MRLGRRADPIPLRSLNLLDLAAILEVSPDRAEAVAAGASALREKPGTGWPEAPAQGETSPPEYAVSYWLLMRRVHGRGLRHRGIGRW